jgi:hypothetical protein
VNGSARNDFRVERRRGFAFMAPVWNERAPISSTQAR